MATSTSNRKEASNTSRQSPERAEQGSFAPPNLSLPKGGGAIRGIGEKFSANPVTGTGSMSVPIAISPGRSGFGPQLSLAYDSGSGNSPFGFGWSLALPGITRKTDKGLPQYMDAADSDVFILSGSEDLVPVIETTGKGALPTDETDDRLAHLQHPTPSSAHRRLVCANRALDARRR